MSVNKRRFRQDTAYVRPLSGATAYNLLARRDEAEGRLKLMRKLRKESAISLSRSKAAAQKRDDRPGLIRFPA
jgi:hypothetical protein